MLCTGGTRSQPVEASVRRSRRSMTSETRHARPTMTCTAKARKLLAQQLRCTVVSQRSPTRWRSLWYRREAVAGMLVASALRSCRRGSKACQQEPHRTQQHTMGNRCLTFVSRVDIVGGPCVSRSARGAPLCDWWSSQYVGDVSSMKELSHKQLPNLELPRSGAMEYDLETSTTLTPLRRPLCPTALAHTL